MLPLLQVEEFFKGSKVYCSKSTYAHQTRAKKKLVSGLVIQIIPISLTRMYHHTATEGLYGLSGVKIS